MLRNAVLIISILIVLVADSFSQNQEIDYKNSSYVELRYQHGFIYKHASAIDRLINGNISAIDINYGWQTKGNALWQQLYRYPKAGVGLYYSMLNYPEILGNAFAGYGFINIPLVKYKDLITISYQTALGASYVTKVYDVNALIKNDAYSTHLNIYFDSSIDLEYNLWKPVFIVAALGITHYSNGAVKMPNLGLNTITYQFGVNYRPNIVNNSRIKNEIGKPKERNQIWIFYSPSIKTVPPKGKTVFFVSSLSVNYNYKINHKRKLGVGLDLFFDESLKSYYVNEGILYKNSFRFRPAYHLSQDLLFGKVSFLLESGWYFINRTENENSFYHRLGIKYQLKPDFFILYALKTHWVTADYMEVALGYNISW